MGSAGCVIFDLDGTLADTSGDLIAAANACFAGLGQGAMLEPEADRAVAFAGGRAMLGLGFRRLGLAGAALEEAVAREFPRLLAYYARNIDRHTRLYPGAVAAFEDLRAQGYALGICTNKPEGLAEELLKRLGVRGLFASLIGADTLAVKKPDPEPLRAAVRGAGGDMGRALLVGDTVTDRETARAAGLPCLLVAFGPEGRAVERLAPEGLLKDYAGLGAAVRALIG